MEAIEVLRDTDEVDSEAVEEEEKEEEEGHAVEVNAVQVIPLHPIIRRRLSTFPPPLAYRVLKMINQLTQRLSGNRLKRGNRR